MAPTYRNERNGDVVTVTGANADRLDSLDNWTKMSDADVEAAAAEQADSQAASVGPVPAGPADAGIGQPNGVDTPVGDAATANDVHDEAVAADEAPKGNASREEWEAYALAHGATETDVADLGRDELRDTYGPKA